jgi:hypothetical protein
VIPAVFVFCWAIVDAVRFLTIAPATDGPARQICEVGLILALNILASTATVCLGAAVSKTVRREAVFKLLLSGGVFGGIGILLFSALPTLGVAVLGEHGFDLGAPGFLGVLVLSSVSGFGTFWGAWKLPKTRPFLLVGTVGVLTASFFVFAYRSARIAPTIYVHWLLFIGTHVLVGTASTLHTTQNRQGLGTSWRSLVFTALTSGSVLIGLIHLAPRHLPPGNVSRVYEFSVSAYRLIDLNRLLQPKSAPCSYEIASDPMSIELPRAEGVVLVVFDTLRFDAMERGYAPQLASFYESSLAFERAYATTPATAGSFQSAINGPAEESLASRLSEEGVATHAVTAHPQVTQVIDGFDHVTQVGQGDLRFQATSPNVFSVALKELDALRRRGGRFFLLVHVIDPHEYYLKHEEFDYGATAEGRYWSEVSFTDSQFGNFVASIERQHKESELALIITSDHGEELGELGYFSHGTRLFDETVRTLLAVKHPSIVPNSLAVPVSLKALPSIIERMLEYGDRETILELSTSPRLEASDYCGCVTQSAKEVQNRILGIRYVQPYQGTSELGPAQSDTFHCLGVAEQGFKRER